MQQINAYIKALEVEDPLASRNNNNCNIPRSLKFELARVSNLLLETDRKITLIKTKINVTNDKKSSGGQDIGRFPSPNNKF